MKRLIVLLLLTVLNFGSTVSLAGTESELIIQAVETRHFDEATAELLKLRAEDESAFIAKDYDYLLGRTAEESDDLSLAMATFQLVASRDGAFKIFALKHLSQIARSTGNLMLERLYLNEILTYSPDSLIAKSAVLRLARNNFERSNYAEAIAILTRSASSPAHSSKAVDAAVPREARALLAELYLRNGEVEQSRLAFTNLLDTVPNASQPDDIALLSVQNLDLIDGGEKGKLAPHLTEAEHFRRAFVYQFNREFADAKLHYDAMVANYPTGANTAEAVFQTGRGFAQQGIFVEALKWFERVTEQYPQSTAAKDALLQAASAYGRVGRPKEAITRYQTFIEKYPADEKIDRAYLNIVDIMRDHGQDTDAIRECEKISEIFRGKLAAATALFTEVRIHFAREEWKDAVVVLDRLGTLPELGGSAVPGGTSLAEVSFLRGFALEQMKRFSEAIETYLSVPDGRGEYYGWRATERLKGIAADETSGQFAIQAAGRFASTLNENESKQKSARAILRLSDNEALRGRALEVLRATVAPLPKSFDDAKRTPPPIVKTATGTSSILDKLIALGLYDEAATEIETVSPEMASLSPEKVKSFSTIFSRGDRADLLIRFVEPMWRSVSANYPLELIPREHLEMLYPDPFAVDLRKYSAKLGIDPRLMLSIMRQESRFQPTARSSAAARGLMQFISTTSNKVAGEVGRENFRQDELYYPTTAIQFGSQYLADLFKVFPDQPDAVVASYNGGDDNMRRWLNRSRSSSQDRYVPEIVYAQSKDYVHRVMSSYRVYKYLYNEQLQPTKEEVRRFH